MLTSDLIKPMLRVQGTVLSVKMVDEQDERLQQTAQDIISLFQQHQGQPQIKWEEALEAYEGARVDYSFIRGLAKVLTDAAEFTPLATPLPPAQIREQIFAYGPVFNQSDIFHPTTRQDLLEQVSTRLNLTPQEMDTLLFADRSGSYHLSNAGPDWTPTALLARYNLELARGVLYWASHIEVEVADNYKDLWKYIKLFKLMFTVESNADGGYSIDLDGPISPFVTATLRYGRQLAAFLPALLLCEQWSMRAHVYPPQARGETLYQLDQHCTLQSHFKRSGPFDSRLEADFAREFAEKMGEKRGHWLLLREDEIIPLADTVMIPDFVLVDTEDANRRILIELVGFWHPHYLRRKVAKVRAANCAHLLLLVYKGLNVTADAFQDSSSEVLFFQQKPVLKEVLATVEAMAERVYGPRESRGHSKNAGTPKL